MNELKDEFREVCEQLCEEFYIDYSKIKSNETSGKYPVGEYYNASIEDGETIIDVTVESLPNNFDENKLEKTAHFSIKETETGSPIQYSISAFDCFAYYDNSLSYWIHCISYQHHIENDPINLKEIFGSHRIQIQGIPSAREPTLSLIYLILSGLDKIKSEQTIVYRFRHMNKDKEFFYSYAFYLPNELWICFLDAAGWGNDSEFLDIEKLLKEEYSFKIKRKFHDVEYEKFESFLAKNAISFPSEQPLPLTVLDPRPPYEKIFDLNFNEAFQEFLTSYKNKNYSNALKQLRVLVQEALEITCKKKNIKLEQIKSRDRGIKSISEILINRQKLNPNLRSWFETFTVIANKASHQVYPKKEDLEIPHVEERIILALAVGMHLIKELDHILRKEITVRAKTGGESFKIYLPEDDELDPAFEIVK